MSMFKEELWKTLNKKLKQILANQDKLRELSMIKLKEQFRNLFKKKSMIFMLFRSLQNTNLSINHLQKQKKNKSKRLFNIQFTMLLTLELNILSMY